MKRLSLILMIISCLIGVYFRLTLNGLASSNFSEISLNNFVRDKGGSLDEFLILGIEDKGVGAFRLRSRQCPRDLYFYADRYNGQIPDELIEKFFPAETWRSIFIYKKKITLKLSEIEKMLIWLRAKLKNTLLLEQSVEENFVFSVMIPKECPIRDEVALAAANVFLKAFNDKSQ